MKKYALVIGKTSLILLFTYAGLVKLLDTEVFRQQLYQSPVLRKEWVPLISYALPVYELLLVAALISDRFTGIVLSLSFFTLLFFTLYLIGLVSFASNVPCSCGGILGHMSYPVHIVFNAVFTLIALYLLLQQRKTAAATLQ